MEWNELLKELAVIIDNALKLGGIAIVTYLGLQFKKFITDYKLDKIIKSSVMWVEQVYGDKFFGEEKLSLAKIRIREELGKLKIEVSEEYLDMIIEAFIFELNKEKEGK